MHSSAGSPGNRLFADSLSLVTLLNLVHPLPVTDIWWRSQSKDSSVLLELNHHKEMTLMALMAISLTDDKLNVGNKRDTFQTACHR